MHILCIYKMFEIMKYCCHNSYDLEQLSQSKMTTTGNVPLTTSICQINVCHNTLITIICSFHKLSEMSKYHSKHMFFFNLVNKQNKLNKRVLTKDPLTFQCAGTRCTAGNTDVDQSYEVRHSVTFIDTSQPATGYVGEPPVFLAKVPYDFFYPFISSSTRTGLSSYLYLVIFIFLCSNFLSQWL